VEVVQGPQVVVQLEQQELPDKVLQEEMVILVIQTEEAGAEAALAAWEKALAPDIKVMVVQVFT
jgi:hypothetical protein